MVFYEIESKKSAAVAFAELMIHEDTTIKDPHGTCDVATLILADIDNALDITYRIMNEYSNATVMGFCGRSFNCRKAGLKESIRLHRSSSGTKNAAEMAMSFHAHRLVSESEKRGIYTVLVVSRDSSLDELVIQLRDAFSEMQIKLISF